MKVRLAIRVFLLGKLHSEDLLTVDTEALDGLLPKLGMEHAHLLAETPGMVEIEFLDQPDQGRRFFRIGTDPSAMVVPIPVDLGDA